jgi:alanine dehydrogenase
LLPDLLHISKADVLALQITPSQMRSAVREAFQDISTGQCRFEPKSQLPISIGHSFQMMAAASHRWSLAIMKWISVVPTAPGSILPGISAVVCVNDLETGHPLAFIDGEVITLLRTAAMATLAAECLAPSQPETLALVGCGAQARSQLDAFCDLFPSIRRVLCYSRSRMSSDSLVSDALSRGYHAVTVVRPEDFLREADIVISMVPAAPGLRPLLDATFIKPNALAIMVDLGRSWIPSKLVEFDMFATDSLLQMRHPLDADGRDVHTVTIRSDLIGGLTGSAGRNAFCFKGHAAGDLAAANLVHSLARKRGVGRNLTR